MTTPKVTTIKRGDARLYVDPDTAQKQPGVTSILSMLPKPFLQFWSAKLVAEAAVDQMPSVLGILLNGDRQGAIDYLKNAPRRFTSGAADVGSAAHDLFEEMAKAYTPGQIAVLPRRVHPDVKVFGAHFVEFLNEFQPEFHRLEETVWDDEKGFAGSFDAMATPTKGPLAGKKLVWDWKTTRSGVHEEVALQLACYRSAAELIDADGNRTPMDETDGAAVLHVRPEGWKVVPVETDEVEGVPLIQVVQALRLVFDWDRELKKQVIGKPLASGGDVEKPAGPRINRPKKVAA